MDGRYSTAHRHDALAFLVHFLGDITQPLHVDSLDGTGGNSIDVSYGSTDTNLHAAWDSSCTSTTSSFIRFFVLVLILRP